MVATLKTSVIQEPSSATVNLTLDASGGVAVGQNLTVAGTTTFTGGSTFTGNATAAAFIPSGSTVPTNGLYLPAANSAGIATASTERLRIGASGNVGIGTTTLNASGSTLSLAIGSSTATDYAGLEFQTAGSLRAFMNATNGAFYIVSASTNPMIFYTNSSERMRINSSGNVGIGSTSPNTKLSVFSSGNTNTLQLMNNAAQDTGGYINSTGNAELMISGGASYNSYSAPNFVMNAKSTIASGMYITGDTIRFWVNTGLTAGTTFNQTERMRIDTSGNLLVGTTVSTAYETNTRLKLNTSGTAQVFNQLQLVNIGSPAAVGDIVGIGFAAGETTQYGVKGSIGYVRTGDYGRGAITFYTNNTAGTASVSTSDERMRIDSSGRLLLGTTTVAGNASTFCSTAGATQQPLSFWNTATAGTRIMCTFGDSASYTERGNINWNGTTMTLATTSDRRLKTNVEPAVGGLDKVLATNVYSYDMQGGHSEFGVIAQEMIDVLPASVCVGEDNEDGSIKRPWSVGYEPMVPMLIKAIQELKAELDALKTKVGA